MSVVAGIFAFIVILAVLILVHEGGHFFMAKLNGVHVEEFGLGFPPRLKGWRRGDTVYSLNAIPLGGFVRMTGENGESERSNSFGAKAPWRRLSILAAGPLMNLLFAVGVFFVAYLIGSPRGITMVTGIQAQTPAARAGIRVGDRIVAINGHPVRWYDDLASAIDRNAGKRVGLLVDRQRRQFTTTLIPRVAPPANQGRMGVVLADSVTVAYGPGPALGRSFSDVASLIRTVPSNLAAIVSSHGNGVEGPIGIAHTTTQVVGQAPNQGPGTILELAALLSVSLGVLNLLPIPALDGGRIVFVLLSWLRRRNLDPHLEGMIHVAGMAALLVLILFVSYHDIARWISGSSF